jgi:hypothetical protein
MKAKKALWMIDAQKRDNPEVPTENANQPKMDFSDQNWMDGIEEQERL